MPKRGKSAEAPQEAEAAEEELPVADLDLSSDEEEDLADDEDESGSEDGSQSDDEVREALADYLRAAAAERPAGAKGDGQRASTSNSDDDDEGSEEDEDNEGHAGRRRRGEANGDHQQRPGSERGPGEGKGGSDPGSDSSEDERPSRNTIGKVPLEWYKAEEHIGYDIEGQKLARGRRGDKLDALLARNDGGKALRTVYDEYNDEEIVLSKDEIKMLMRIRRGQFPHMEVDPFPDYYDITNDEVEATPLTNMPEPKSRFIPSKWEEKKIVKLVRAIRNGWIKTRKQKASEAKKEQEVYLLWGDDDQVANRTGAGLTFIPAAKQKMPGHEESYNPPKEYLPTEEEKTSWQLLDEEERPKFVPRAFESLRSVPMYSDFIKEQFERCLDLYLCPRVRKKRLHVNPESLVPKLPKPQDLQPFPTTLAVRYEGHVGKVRSVAPHPGGQWLATGGQDGTVRLWEVTTGRCIKSWSLGAPALSVAWCPNPALQLLAVAAGAAVVLLPSGLGGPAAVEAAAAALEVPSSGGGAEAPLAAWSRREDGGVDITSKHPVAHVTWHARGDYFASVAPTGATQSVLVHQLSKRATQNPFRRNRGRATRCLFHPTKPFFFVATQNHVRVYNLAKQALAKKLIGGSGVISCMAVHPGGDHVLVGSDDKRLAWYDMDLSATPYKALRYHTQPLRGVCYHSSYPLFASASDDGSVHVFHGRVYADMMTNPLIVPVKVLRGHTRVDSGGVLDVAFHPTQPWVFTAGADGQALLFCN